MDERLDGIRSILHPPGGDNCFVLLDNEGAYYNPVYSFNHPRLGPTLALTLTQRGGETGTMMLSLQMKRFMTYGLPALSGLFMLAWPGAMQLTFFATSMMSLVQATLFRNPSFRQWLGIYPLPSQPVTPAPGAAQTPKSSYDGTMTLYQPPDANTGEAAEKKGILHGAISEIQGMKTEAIKSMKKVVGATNESGGRRKRTASELKAARAYEERRRREIAQEKIERGLARSRMNRSKMLKDKASSDE